MKTRMLTLSTAAVAGLLVLGVAGPASAADTWTVCATGCDSTTIQGAVDLAAPGDTVTVAAGTYTEIVNVNVADLVLQGAQAGVDARTRTGATETIILGGQFKLLADGLTIDGFTFDMNSTSTSATTGTGLDGLTIINNIIENGVQGLVFDNPGPAAALVQHNSFRNNSGNGIQMFGLSNSQNVSILANDFSGGHGAAINVIGSHLTIDGNTSTNDYTLVVVTDSQDVTISNNVMTDADAGSGIFLGLGNDGVVVSGNSLDSAAAPGDDTSAIRISTAFGGPAASKNYTITGNIVTGGWSHAIRTSAGAYDGSLAAHGNQFDMVVTNGETDPARVIDARNNWWDPSIDLSSMANVLTDPACANRDCVPVLAATGMDAELPLGLAGGLVALGGLFALLARRRRSVLARS